VVIHPASDDETISVGKHNYEGLAYKDGRDGSRSKASNTIRGIFGSKDKGCEFVGWTCISLSRPGTTTDLLLVLGPMEKSFSLDLRPAIPIPTL
jgi:hypothetical protein